MHSQKKAGFSLIELLVLTALIGLLAGLAMPSLTSTLQNQERRGTLHDLLGLFALARQHAVMEGVIVTVCPVNSMGACSRDWNNEIYAFSDPDNQRQLTAGKAPLRVVSTGGSGRIVVRSLHRSYFQFRPSGFVHSDLGNVTWCPNTGNASLAGQIIISRGGRARLANDHDGDGIPEDAQGRPLKCS